MIYYTVFAKSPKNGGIWSEDFPTRYGAAVAARELTAVGFEEAEVVPRSTAPIFETTYEGIDCTDDRKY